MNLWPPPRRVEVLEAADPLVLPAGAVLSLRLTGEETTQPAVSAEAGESTSGGGPEGPRTDRELALAIDGLRRALAAAGQRLVPSLPLAGAEEGSGAANRDLAAPNATSVDSASEAAADCRVRVGSLGAENGSPPEFPTDESYRLRIDGRGIRIDAATPTGVFRAASTLKQWLPSRGRPTAVGFEVPAVEIEDRPDFPIRGAMLDVSRNRVPTMAYLKRLIDRFAEWKINHLQLYVEHTYAYADHEEVWRDASPFTAEEIRELDAYCRERFIELAPNQNSFGHFHRWLVHDRYRPLAEVPEGFRHPFSIDPEPFSLCATDPRVLALLAGLYDELLPQFTSRRFNVGLDETFDLGRGRSAEACAERGSPAVYLDFLRRVHRMVSDRGRQTLFWGDIVLKHPELIDRIPEDAVALCWGYEADHPFEDQCARLAASGREFWVCPGTSSWNSFGGRLRNAVSNLAAAASAGMEAGARGFLVTDWGDHGHLQPPAIAELPLSIGAGFAWSVDAARRQRRESATVPETRESRPRPGPGPAEPAAAHAEPAAAHAEPAAAHAEPAAEPWREHASRFVYDGDDALAGAVVELGAVGPECGGPAMNGTPLFYLLRFLDEDLTHRRFSRLSVAKLQRAYVRLAAVRDRLAGATGDPAGSDPQRAALDWTCRLMGWCCQLGIARLAAGRGLRANRLAPRVRATLAAELRHIVGDLAHVWLKTSREGGLRDSQDLLLRAADALHDP